MAQRKISRCCRRIVSAPVELAFTDEVSPDGGIRTPFGEKENATLWARWRRPVRRRPIVPSSRPRPRRFADENQSEREARSSRSPQGRPFRQSVSLDISMDWKSSRRGCPQDSPFSPGTVSNETTLTPPDMLAERGSPESRMASASALLEGSFRWPPGSAFRRSTKPPDAPFGSVSLSQQQFPGAPGMNPAISVVGISDDAAVARGPP